MKKNILLIAAMVLFATGTFTSNTLQAQPDQAAPPAGGQPVSPPPGRPQGRPGGPPGMRGRSGMSNYHGIAMSLKRIKADLEKSKEDYDGHRQSAIEACDKAAQELEAVATSIKAAEAAKAAAAKAAAEAAQPAAPAAATPAAPPASTPAPNQ